MKEHEPHESEDKHRETGRDGQEREHRRAGFGLARLGRGFDNVTLSLCCHGRPRLLNAGDATAPSAETNAASQAMFLTSK
jgi:hypothetical protein